MAAQDEYYDLVIIGSGPAGLSAGIYGGRALLKTVILEKGSIGGRVTSTTEIVNYPSVEETTGQELIDKMVSHVKKFGVEIRQQAVRKVDFSGVDKLLFTRKVTYHAKAVVIATGTHPHIVGFPGEGEFTGRGVSYCATCDAEFYKDQDVAVIGCGDQAVEEGEFITKYANSVTIVSRRRDHDMSCNAIAAERAYNNPKMRFKFNSQITEVYGENEVEGIRLQNKITGEMSDLPCQGVFFFTGSDPETDFLGDQVPKDEKGWLHTGDDMDLGIGGVFAAGDVRHKYLRQIS
ncbi:MAG: FAD-dependent oxidoreductase, partial [Eggerthellaceae bacterium]|nr:FAD-dependent oxidoreductase [Eggerthellaceae bacterium]